MGFTVQDPAGGDHSTLLIYGSEEYVNVAGTAEICNNEMMMGWLRDFDDRLSVSCQRYHCDCPRGVC